MLAALEPGGDVSARRTVALGFRSLVVRKYCSLVNEELGGLGQQHRGLRREVVDPLKGNMSQERGVPIFSIPVAALA